MKTKATPSQPAPLPNRATWGFLGLVVAAGALVYVNSFAGVFLPADLAAIAENEDVLGFDLGNLLRGRPVTNLSFALNHELGGLNVGGYHAFNLVVHLLAACTLFGVVRRTLLLPATGARFADRASWIACAVALLWVVHPLLTESVTYVAHRGTALAGLFSLLTLYAIARGAASPRAAAWYGCAVIACALAMGSKAVAVSTPIVALLYDRVFIASSFRELARRRWPLHAGLAATWAVLVLTGVAGTIFLPGDADVSRGFGYDGITPLGYLAAQPAVILHYLRLAVWPSGLTIDYWWTPASAALARITPAIAILLLLAATALALRKRPRAGFVAAAFFLLLAPTSSFVPIRELAAEHRMYLPLATVLVLVVLGAHTLLSRLGAARLAPAAILVLLLAVAGLGAATMDRNRDYHDVETMWRDIMAKRPGHPLAAQNLGTILADEGRFDEALDAFRRALEVPDYRDLTYLAIAQTQRRAGRADAAIEAYTLSIQANPSRTGAYHSLANLLVLRGRLKDAIPYFEEVTTREPDNAAAHADLGRTYAAAGQLADAVRHLERAVALDPKNPQVQNNLGGVYALQGRLQIALDRVIEAVRLNPEYNEAVENLGRLMVRAADPEAIVARHRAQVDLTPALARAWAHRGDIALDEGRDETAVLLYRRALELEPGLERAVSGLARTAAKGQ